MTKADAYLVRDISNILENGFWDENPRPVYEDGTPAHTISVNHVVRRYDLAKGEFPICTLRRQAWKTGIREIFTIYQHPTNVLSEMKKYGVTWWDPWDIGDGTIGQRYGATVKRYDLMHRLIEDIRRDPYGRRKVVSLWQESDLRETLGLAPCAFLTMWNVRGDYLDMSLIQRSGDMLTASGGGGINEIQYAALLMMVANTVEKRPGVFTHFVANEQIYDRHMENAKELQRRAAAASGPGREDGSAAASGSGRGEGSAAISGPEQGERSAAAASSAASSAGGGSIGSQPMLVLHKEPGSPFEEYVIGDFEMQAYAPMEPQLTFELGI